MELLRGIAVVAVVLCLVALVVLELRVARPLRARGQAPVERIGYRGLGVLGVLLMALWLLTPAGATLWKAGAAPPDATSILRTAVAIGAGVLSGVLAFVTLYIYGMGQAMVTTKASPVIDNLFWFAIIGGPTIVAVVVAHLVGQVLG